MKTICYIGGSPCSGKSTVAQALAERYGLTPFKVDDHLDALIDRGAAFLPEIVQGWGVPPQRYVAITPAREFQWSRYSQHPWVPHVLRDCSDQQATFANWMARDALFAEEVRRQCGRLGCLSLLTDSSVPENARLREVARHFSLE